MRWRMLVGAIVVPAVMAVPFVAAASAPATLRISGVDLSRYPVVRVSVSVSGLPEGQVLSGGDVELKENGLVVPGLALRPLAAEPKPIAVALLVDTSASMKGDPLKSAVAAAQLFVERARPQDQTAIVSFSSTYTLVRDFTTDKRGLVSALAGLRAGGETAAYDALAYALQRIKTNPIGDKYVIILTDGADTASKTTFAAAGAAAKTSGVAVIAIALRSPEFNPSAIAQLAAMSGGRMLVAPNPAALTGLYEQLAKELHGQYELSYVSLRPATEKLNLSVEANIGGATVRALHELKNPAAKKETTPPEKPPVRTAFGRAKAIIMTTGFASLFFFALAAFSILFREELPLKKQMEFYKKVSRERAGAGAGARTGLPSEGRLFSMIKRLMSGWKVVEHARIRLERAGLPLRPVEFGISHFLLVVLFGLVAWAGTGSVIKTGLLMAVAVITPLVAVRILIAHRKKRFHAQLPDVLSMIAGSFRAGSSFMQALTMVVDESEPPISSEFRRILAEVRLGRSVRDALDRMADRVDLLEFRWTVLAIDIQHEVGGNLAEVLDTLAETIRDSNAVKRQISALAAEGKLSAIILMILPFAQALILYMVNPGYILLLFTEPLGLAMLGIALVLLVMGGLWLRKMIAIEV